MVLAVIENISVIGFVDFAVRIADQHVVLAHVGPVGSGIRGRQVTQLVLFDGVLRRLILRRRRVANLEFREVSDELLFFIGLDAGGCSGRLRGRECGSRQRQ